MKKLLLIISLLCTSCAVKQNFTTVQGDKIKIEGAIKVSHLCDKKWIERYEKRDLAVLKERAKSEEKECDVMFFGSSSIRRWKTLQQDMAPLKVVNRGYGGATLRDLHHNYEVVMADYKPKCFVVYCDNDMRTNPKIDISVGELFDLYRMLFDRLAADYPNVPVYFMAIKHNQRREALRERHTLFNSLMKEYAERSSQVTFVDTCSVLHTADGEIDPAMFVEDKLHVNALGYARWTALIKPMLLKELGVK